jgi:hypothetical protein
MKIAELNIGLSSKSLGKLNPETVLNELRVCDFRIIASRVAESESIDGKEQCLTVKVELPENWQRDIAYLADKLGQDCIAVCGFIGQAPYDTFCAGLWVSPEKPKEEPKETSPAYVDNLLRFSAWSTCVFVACMVQRAFARWTHRLERTWKRF